VNASAAFCATTTAQPDGRVSAISPLFPHRPAHRCVVARLPRGTTNLVREHCCPASSWKTHGPTFRKLRAEYILSGGNEQVIFCERGIRTFSTHSRNTLDLGVVPLVRQLSHLPILVDPSHGVGKRERVRAMARAAIACGAQGLLIETHFDPETSYTDADQTISTTTLAGIGRDLEVLAQLEA